MYSFTLEPTFHKGYLVVQPRSGFRFGVDSVILAHMVRSVDIDSVLELGAGSGIISLTLFSHGIGNKFVLVDKDKLMCEALKMTVAVNDLRGIFMPICNDIQDLIGFNMEFDLVIFNPPYYLSGKARGDMARVGTGKDFLNVARNSISERGIIAYIIDGNWVDVWEAWELELGLNPLYIGEYVSKGGKNRMVRIVGLGSIFIPYREMYPINGPRVKEFYTDGGI